MTKRDYLVLTALACIAGGLCGLLTFIFIVNSNVVAGARQTVTVEKIWLVDSNGRIRGMLGVTDEDDAGLVLYSQSGEPTVVIRSTPTGSFLDLTSESRVSAARLEINRQSSSLRLKTRKNAAMIDATNEAAAVHLYDADERLRAALGSSKIADVKTGTYKPGSQSSLSLFNTDGKLIWSAPAD